MATNDGVGKKIVEALKKQSNQEVELAPEYVEPQEEILQEVQPEESFETIESEVESLYSGQFEQEKEPAVEDRFEIKEEPVSNNVFVETPVVENKAETSTFSFEQQPQTTYTEPQGWNFSQVQEPEQPVFAPQQPVTVPVQTAKQFDMPPNVSVLKKLIAQLPTGVTKQTGAQIIKQTMEALGISMSTVLHEAQKVQDDMNESIKNCMMSIQEYKNNIKNLEKQGLDYQRQVNQLNDLISLFILSDKD